VLGSRKSARCAGRRWTWPRHGETRPGRHPGKGEGLRIQANGKTATSTRTIERPADVVARQVAAESNEWDVVFSSPVVSSATRPNTSNDVSELTTDAGHGWATAHTFRHTVATLLALAGLSAREIANYLGHAPATTTQDVYMSRHTGLAPATAPRPPPC
jgi:integrase